MDILSLVANSGMYGDCIFSGAGNLLKFFPIRLNEHASPATLLLKKSGIAEYRAVKCAKLQEGAIVEIVEVSSFRGNVLGVLAVGFALWRVTFPMKHSNTKLISCHPVRNEHSHRLRMLKLARHRIQSVEYYTGERHHHAADASRSDSIPHHPVQDRRRCVTVEITADAELEKNL